MTDAEARQVWCPKVVYVYDSTDDRMYNNRGDFGDGCCCLGSKCGMWVKDHPEVSREEHSGGKESIIEFGIKTERTPIHDGFGCQSLWILRASGHCGLINKGETK